MVSVTNSIAALQKVKGPRERILAVHAGSDHRGQGRLGGPAAAAEAGAVVAVHVAPADAAAVPAALAAVAVAHPPSVPSRMIEILQLEPISSIGR